MKYFLQLLCFAFMFGIYLTYDDLYMFMPQQKIPPPKCPPNEVFKICLSNCSNCEQRGYCILRECKENGCDCIPHFVRLEPGGPCEPVSKCPQPECEENEVFRECGPMCERCGTFNCKMVHCEHRCYCKEGYKRNEEWKCVPEEECFPKTRCPREEEMRDSGYEDEYCLHEDGQIVSNATVNITQCYCKEGFKRNGLGHCMAEKYCAIVKCMGIETYQNCPRKCNATCRTYGDPDCVEDGHCYPGCFCPEGYLMNDFRICVPLEQCPPDSNPYVPTRTPEEETTIPSSINEDLRQNETTTPSPGESEDQSEKSSNSEAIAEAVAVAEAKDEELPENLPGEDIVPDKATEEGTESSTETTSTPRRKSSRRPHSSKSRARVQKAGSHASAEAEAGSHASAEAEADSDASAKAEADAALEAISKADFEEKE